MYDSCRQLALRRLWGEEWRKCDAGRRAAVAMRNCGLRTRNQRKRMAVVPCRRGCLFAISATSSSPGAARCATGAAGPAMDAGCIPGAAGPAINPRYGTGAAGPAINAGCVPSAAASSTPGATGCSTSAAAHAVDAAGCVKGPARCAAGAANPAGGRILCLLSPWHGAIAANVDVHVVDVHVGVHGQGARRAGQSAELAATKVPPVRANQLSGCNQGSARAGLSTELSTCRRAALLSWRQPRPLLWQAPQSLPVVSLLGAVVAQGSCCSVLLLFSAPVAQCCCCSVLLLLSAGVAQCWRLRPGFVRLGTRAATSFQARRPYPQPTRKCGAAGLHTRKAVAQALC